MTYQIAKEVINKVITIVKEIEGLDNEELSSLVNSISNDNRANLIQALIRSKLTTEEYDIYIKYCEFYKSQKSLEFKETVLALNSQIDYITELYDKRQDILRKKYRYSDETVDIKRMISTLPWIRLKIAYGNLEKEHSNYIKVVTSGIIRETGISDEIASIEHSNIITRTRNKKKLVALHEKEESISSKNTRNSTISKAKVEKLYNEYIRIVNEFLYSVLDNPHLYEMALKSYPLFTKKSLEELDDKMKKSTIVDAIIAITVKKLEASEESATTCIEEGYCPPFGKLNALTPQEYEEVLTSYILKYLNVSIGRCDSEASNIMVEMKDYLNEQKECLAHLSDNQDGIILDRVTPTAEEQDIFQLIYKESKK